MPYTEFYCDASTGSNLNAGDDKPIITSTNGDWGIAAPNRFTAAFGGTPFSSVSVGDFASIYADGATVTGYVGRVTAVNGGGASLDISSTAKSGTAPSNSAILRSCTVGGKWKGPNGTSGFPFGFVAATMTNASSDYPRVNFKNTSNYSVTSAITHNVTGPVLFQGYTNAPGDKGKAIIDGGTTGASYALFTVSALHNFFTDFIFQNNGATGVANGFVMSASAAILRVVVNSIRGVGIVTTSSSNNTEINECEAYGCNQSNTSTYGGFYIADNCWLRRCISHDNSGSNSVGFHVQAANVIFIECIADTNGSIGFNHVASLARMQNCIAYNNTSDGMRANTTSVIVVSVENSIFAKNGGYGINLVGGGRYGPIANCAFGAGTFANTSGQINLPASNAIIESGGVTLTSNISPWNDEANGNFQLNATLGGGAACRNAGIGAFTQTAAGYSGTISYPSIGSTEPLVTSGGGGGSSSFIG